MPRKSQSYGAAGFAFPESDIVTRRMYTLTTINVNQ
jgi:hypothetical protein